MAWWSRVPTLRRMAEPSVRTITDDELGAYINVVRTAFVEGPASDEEIEARRPHTDLARALGAYDEDGRMCGAARAFGTQLTVPGGSTLPCAAVTSVGVLPTHTRRGHLTRLMRTQLDDVAERGEPVAAPDRGRVPDLRALRLRPGHRGHHPARRHRRGLAGATTPSAPSSSSTRRRGPRSPRSCTTGCG